MTADRWCAFDRVELSLLHHALRMLAKYPSEREAATKLADEVWNVHLERLESSIEGEY